MDEIYLGHADNYDELVIHEDWEHNLDRALHALCSWDRATVVESGIGTGRMTRLYIEDAARVLGFDRSRHMLDQAAKNLGQWSDRLSLAVAEHRALPVSDGIADRFVEGWAFGHSVVAGGDRRHEIRETTDALVAEAERVCRRDGSITIIETLGTNVEEPRPPGDTFAEFYDRLEDHHGFARLVVSTDYRFSDPETAIRVCGYFFGKEMTEALEARYRQEAPTPEGAIVPESAGTIVPEFTGIWHRTR